MSSQLDRRTRRVTASASLCAARFARHTSSLLLLSMAWDAALGSFPVLGPLGQFLIKDVALLGVALFVTGESLVRLRPTGAVG
jgi:uncharacterized membrane protein YkgB